MMCMMVQQMSDWQLSTDWATYVYVTVTVTVMEAVELQLHVSTCAAPHVAVQSAPESASPEPVFPFHASGEHPPFEPDDPAVRPRLVRLVKCKLHPKFAQS